MHSCSLKSFFFARKKTQTADPVLTSLTCLTDNKTKQKNCWRGLIQKTRATKTSHCHFWAPSHNPQLLVISQQLEIKRVIRNENNVGIADCGLERQIPLGDTSLSKKGALDLKALIQSNCSLCETAQAFLITSIKLQAKK